MAFTDKFIRLPEVCAHFARKAEEDPTALDEGFEISDDGHNWHECPDGRQLVSTHPKKPVRSPIRRLSGFRAIGVHCRGCILNLSGVDEELHLEADEPPERAEPYFLGIWTDPTS